MDTAENRIVTNMQIESEFGDADQNIKSKVKMSKSEPLAVGNEWSEQVVDNDYDWSEPEVAKRKKFIYLNQKTFFRFQLFLSNPRNKTTMTLTTPVGELCIFKHLMSCSDKII